MLAAPPTASILDPLTSERGPGAPLPPAMFADSGTVPPAMRKGAYKISLSPHGSHPNPGIPSLSAAAAPEIGFGSAAADAHRGFDFWTEDENLRFVKAIETFQCPPDIADVAARMGNKSAEQTTSYAALYIEAANHKREANGGNFGHITAAEVYAYHGVGPLYMEFLRSKQGRLSSDSVSSAVSCASTERALSLSSPPKDQKASDTDNMGMSIDALLCNAEPAPCASKASPEGGGGPSASSTMPALMTFGDAMHQHQTQPQQQQQRLPSVLSQAPISLSSLPYLDAATAHGAFMSQFGGLGAGHAHPHMPLVSAELLAAYLGSHGIDATHQLPSNVVHSAVGGSNPFWLQQLPERVEQAVEIPAVRPSKRKAAAVEEKSMEETHQDIQDRHVPSCQIWSYSAMQSAGEKPVEDVAAKNPWEWSRKALVKNGGNYSLWFPLFHEHILLSKRDVSDDMRTIRLKAPPPPPPQEFKAEVHNPYSRKNMAVPVIEKRVGRAKAPSGGRGSSGVDSSTEGAPAKMRKSSSREDLGDVPAAVQPPAKKARGGGRAGAKEAVKEPVVQGKEDGAAAGGTGKSEWPRAGDAVEVLWDGEWWEAEVKKVKTHTNLAKRKLWVSYVGGTEEEEEWVPIGNVREPVAVEDKGGEEAHEEEEVEEEEEEDEDEDEDEDE
eukprot:CAMPEP_0173445556 /NCGR_PEP_ID=MMETSP1357-20121228/34590_1 /TAXON_ID=77926 /ORGANISM="Hemiselmis rufescens, Strain PCC563" /LENGTH=666 /DNA_ID=CAMNT_0014411749 /DNA_START=105 /DNA_END=2102 /DNA_ORIENTATION=+